MSSEKQDKRKKIKSTPIMGQLMADYFAQLDQAAKTGDKKIAWCTSVGPAELLLSLGFLVYYPENHSAMLGSTRMATDLIPYAVAEGYSPEICSYLTADIGSFLKRETPLTRAFGMEQVPKADVLVYNTNQCRDVKDWFSWYADKYKVPLLGIDTPRNLGKISNTIIKSIAGQIEQLINPLEEISGQKFELDKFKTVLGLSRECSELWKKVLDTTAVTPSPLTFFDATIQMAPAVVLRGLPQAVDYYKILLKELEERIENEEGAVQEEKFRLYWDGMPVWGRLRAHSELFAGLKTSVLASTYCNSWIFTDFDESDPFESMAKAYTELFIVRSDQIKEKYMENMLKFFKIDGVLYHDAKTCPNNSNNLYGMPKRLQQKTGVPYLVIDGDLNDLRLISDEQTRTNIEAFIEQLEERS